MSLTHTISVTSEFASRRLLSTTLVLLLLSGLSHAQSNTDGSTPPYLTPGAPVGSYGLSGFESINLFNGGLNFSLPLLNIGGRGGANMASFFRLQQKWRVERWASCSPCDPYEYASYNWWTFANPGYGPGIMEGRNANQDFIDCQGYSDPRTSLIRLMSGHIL